MAHLRLIFIALLILILTPSFLIPMLVGHWIEEPNLESVPRQDSNYASALMEAFRLERNGELEGAWTKYNSALEAQSAIVREPAVKGIERVESELRMPFSLRP